jgi:RNase P/RNase MRP subunit p30
MFVILRSTANKRVQLLTQPWRVGELPSFVLKRGPWKIVARSDETHLKLNYRRALAREGYCVVDPDTSLYRTDHVAQNVH